MHVEIQYQGEPTDFGWLLPLPVVPTDENNVMKPLEEVLFVSTAALFNSLQSATNPEYRVNNRFEDEHCDSDEDGFLASPGNIQDAAVSGESGGAPPPVVVLQEAEIGPFGAQLIQAQDTDTLYTWLEENGYVQDEAAKPILKNYIEMNYVFLGLKLLSGKETGDIVPVELRLGDTDSCIPLTLTSIAASENMPILVWVLGDHRAIPKNFLHAVINPRAVSWPGAANYLEVITAAVDSVAGHAFVTEYASNEKLFDGRFWNEEMTTAKESVEGADTLKDMLPALKSWNGSTDPDLIPLLQASVTMPADLKGYPHGDCYYGGGGSYYDGYGGFAGEYYNFCEPDEEHVTTTAEFYSYLGYWVEKLEEGQIEIQADIPALKAALLAGYFLPREHIQDMFDGAEWVSRFFTTVSPDEMNRDPIFMFNPELEAVSHIHTLDTVVRLLDDCETWQTEATYPDGGVYIFPCEQWRCMDLRTVGPVAEAPPLLGVEVLDEEGEAQRFDPEEVIP